MERKGRDGEVKSEKKSVVNRQGVDRGGDQEGNRRSKGKGRKEVEGVEEPIKQNFSQSNHTHSAESILKFDYFLSLSNVDRDMRNYSSSC